MINKELTLKQELEETAVIEWLNGLDKILDTVISDDLAGSGMYLDDDIGDASYIMDLETVKEHMALVLLDCYRDNIGDIVSENLGSDFKDTI